MTAEARWITGFCDADELSAPDEHPAIRAWTALHPLDRSFARPEMITSKDKAAVWRLHAAGLGGTNVIAKLARHDSASIERTLYEQVLPRLSVATPDYLGCLDEGMDVLWLFIGDAGDHAFSYADERQATLAAEWLARLHVEGSRVPGIASLPERGPGHFKGRLEAARAALTARLGQRPDATDGEVIARLLDQCAVLDRRWPEIEAFCAHLPSTVVHGDFAALNVRVHHEPGGDRILAFDWEKAGYAAPVVDMARGLDLRAYWRGIREAWPEMTLDDVRLMALVARVFRPLSHNWARKTPTKLRDHYVHMQQTIEALGWTTHGEVKA